MSNISSISRTPSWEEIKETALQNQNLNADIRVGSRGVEINASSYWQQFQVAMGLEKAPVYTSREETLVNLREQFGLDFSNKLRILIQETGIKTDSEEYKSLITHAMQSFEVITQKLATTTPIDTISTSQAIQEADEGALTSLALLRERFATPQLTPQFCKTSDGKWSVLQAAPHPENFVLSGGGVKGAGYVGWFKAAEQFGVLKNLKRLAGSSAGAITAALIASGMNADDFKKASERTSFWSILTRTSSDPIINAATKLDKKGWFSNFSFSGTYAVDHLNQEMVGSIRKYFNGFKTKNDFETKIEKIKSDKNISDQEKNILQELYEKITLPPQHWLFGSWFQKKKPTYMVTFQDLATLSKIDSRFKELTVTGYSLTGEREDYFNAIRTPEIPIAEAVRSSMSLPGVFNRVLIHDQLIIDGGVGSNTPAEVFQDYSPSTTLVLQFENNGRFNQIVYGSKKKEMPESFLEKKEEKMEEVLTGNPYLKKDCEQDEKKLHNAGPNAMVVEEGDLGVVTFSADLERIHRAEKQAKIRAMETFSLRQNQAVDHVFNSLEEAMKAMNSSELKSIIDFYGFTPPQYDSDYEKSTGPRRAASQELSGEDRIAIVAAAEEELRARSQPDFRLNNYHLSNRGQSSSFK